MLFVFVNEETQAKRGEVPCPRSRSGQLAGVLSRVSKACLVVKLDALYGFSRARVFTITSPSSSTERSPVSPAAGSPSPTACVSHFPQHQRVPGRKGNLPQAAPPQSEDRNGFTPVNCQGPHLPVNFSECSRGREAAREIHFSLTPMNTGISFNNSSLFILPTAQTPISTCTALRYKRHR